MISTSYRAGWLQAYAKKDCTSGLKFLLRRMFHYLENESNLSLKSDDGSGPSLNEGVFP